MQAVIGTSSGETHSIDLDDQQEQTLIGKQIGDTVDGAALGLDGYTLEITGGSDQDGFPMRDEIPGTGRRKVLAGDEIGQRDLRDGERRRVSVRGNIISDAIEQVNLTVTEEGDDSVEELLHGGEDDEE